MAGDRVRNCQLVYPAAVCNDRIPDRLDLRVMPRDISERLNLTAIESRSIEDDDEYENEESIRIGCDQCTK
jgi:hypothetical protein